MDNYKNLMQSLSQLLLPAYISPRKSDLIERVLLIKCGNLSYSDLWQLIPAPLRFENSEDPNKINFRYSGNLESANKLLKFMRDNCDPNTTLTTQDENQYIMSLDFGLVKTRLLPYLQTLVNTMIKEKVPELTPHRIISECEPLVLKQYYKKALGIDDPDNPLGLLMKEIDDNLAKLGISICYSKIMEYSLILLAGERDPTLEKVNEATTPIQISKSPIDGYVHCGWGLYYKPFDEQSSARFWISNPLLVNVNEERSINFSINYKKGRDLKKISTYLESLCTGELSNNSSYISFALSPKEYYEKVLPKFKEFIYAMTRSEFPELYENLKHVSQADPDVQRLQNEVDKTWKSTPIYFPENRNTPTPIPTPPQPAEVEPAKPKHHHGFFYYKHKLKNALTNCCNNIGRQLR